MLPKMMLRPRKHEGTDEGPATDSGGTRLPVVPFCLGARSRRPRTGCAACTKTSRLDRKQGGWWSGEREKGGGCLEAGRFIRASWADEPIFGALRLGRVGILKPPPIAAHRCEPAGNQPRRVCRQSGAPSIARGACTVEVGRMGWLAGWLIPQMTISWTPQGGCGS